MQSRRALRGLYAITAERDDLTQLLAEVDAALSGGARLLQYRSKQLSTCDRETQARALLGVCRRHGVPLLINDDSTLAAAIGADGVHLGRDDAAVADARGLLGPAAIIGVSCYDSLALARDAVDAGADYVAFGSMYPTTRKPQAPRATLALLREARQSLPRPICAIGGITVERAPELIEAGAAMLAVIGDLFDRQDPARAAAAFRRLFGPE